MSKLCVYISAGHNKRDPGACSKKSGEAICEADEVRELADEVADALKASGIKAYRDAWSMSWQETVDDANAKKVDLFIELHENAGGGDGAEVIIHNKDNQFISDAFKKQFLAMGQQWRRTIVDPAYWVLKYTYAPAAIVEVCFVDGKDVLDFDSKADKRRAAQYLAKAVCDCLGVKFTLHASDDSEKPPRKPKAVRVNLPDVLPGDKTPAARRAMALLRYRGYLPDDYFCGVGAVFSGKAVEALREFKRKNKLPVNNKIGPRTWYQLIAD